MAQKTVPETNSDLLGGWLPKDWVGNDMPKPRRQKKTPTPPPELTPKQIEAYRRCAQWLRAVSADNAAAGRLNWIPLDLETNTAIKGEKHFLTLCQVMYREMKCKGELGERLEGEDLIQRLINWWAQGPLKPADLRCAMRGTSLDLGDDDDGED